MWKNPYYYFRIQSINKNGQPIIKDYVIDVTKSAWAKEISPDFKKVLDILLDSSSVYTIKSVLDFGCGKLTSINYILGKNKKLVAVDFKELFDKYPYLNQSHDLYKKNPLFLKLDFPENFILDKNEFDLVILGNVLPVMPVFLERLYLFSLIWDKIKNEKYLLWYAMMNPSVYRKKERTNHYILGDGLWLGESSKKVKTFYKYHPPDYLTLILYLCGFKLERKFKVPSVDCILYIKTEHNFLQNIITPDIISKNIKSQVEFVEGDFKPLTNFTSEIIPNPLEFNLYNIIKKILSSIIPGNKKPNPTLFKYLLAGIFQYLFFNQLTNMQTEDKLNDGREIIDITFQITSHEGIFTKLQASYGISCPIVFIEAKNLTKELENEEYNQLYNRFDEKRGKFGIIVCRNKFDESKVLKQLKDRKGKGFAVVLDDVDVLSLIKLRMEDGEEAVNDYFDREIKKILM